MLPLRLRSAHAGHETVLTKRGSGALEGQGGMPDRPGQYELRMIARTANLSPPLSEGHASTTSLKSRVAALVTERDSRRPNVLELCVPICVPLPRFS